MTLDANRASPDAVSLLEQARSAFLRRACGAPDVGAAVLVVDGRDMGPAPLQMQLAAGSHTVEARADDGRSAERTVELAGGKKIELELTLEATVVPAPTEAAARSPSGAMTPEPWVAPPSPPLPEPVHAHQGSKVPGIALLGVGAILAGAAALCLFEAQAMYGSLTSVTGPHLSPDDENGLAARGQAFRTVGWVGVPIGAVAVVLGILLLALSAGGDT